MAVSACPARLDECAATYDRLDGDLLATHAWLSTALSGFVLENRWGSLDAYALVGAVSRWVAANGQDSSWLRAVAQAFRDADADPDAAADARGAELCHASDAQISRALSEVGFPPLRTALVVTPSAATAGATTSRGAATGEPHDPARPTSGGYVEVDVDLGFGPALRGLEVRRTYGSLDDAVGPFGPGWSSWASTRLRRDPRRAAVHLRGPDGQVVEIPLPAGTVAGFPGRIEPGDLAAPGEPGEPGEAREARDDDETGFVVRFPLEHLCWRFDPEGRLVEIDPGPGRRVLLGWEGDRLVQLAHERGRSLSFAWVADRIVAAVADDGRRVAYAYDDAGRLVTVRGPMGARHYTWDAGGRIEATADADGVVAVRTTYDRSGRIIAQHTAAGRRVRFTHRPDRVTEVGDDRGGPSNRWVHDEDGRLVQVVDGLGRATTTLHDDEGRRIRVIDRRGGATSYRLDGAGRCRQIERSTGTVVALDWDDRHRCVAVTGPDGATCRYGYTGDDRVPTTIEDPEGGVTRLEVVGGLVRRVVDADGVALRFDHDDQGRLVAVIDGDGAVLRYEWDAAGHLVALTSPLGHRLTVERDPAGLVVGWRRPDGAEWRVERSAAGRVVAVTDPAGSRRELRRGSDGEVVDDVDPTGAATRFERDEHGAVVAVTTPGGGRWTFGHDALLRPITITDPTGATWQREYDPEGALVATVTPTGVRRAATVDEAGAVTRIDDGLTSVRFAYDAAGRAVRQTRPDGTTARALYDRNGRIVAITEPDGSVARLVWSPAGRLTAVVGPSGSRIAYRYDHLGRLVEVVDAEGGRRHLRYDREGRVVGQTGPTGETTAYVYDAAGRVVEVTAPGGAVTHHAYDAAGRRSSVTGPDAAVTRWSYDAAGRLVAVTDPNGGVTRFEHDLAGRVVAQVDPTGARWSHRLDARGNPVETTDPEGRTTGFGDDLAGRPVRRIDPDGTRHWWCWDAADRLSAHGAGAVETRFTYDELGRVTRIDDNRGGVATRGWDAAGRLVAETVGTFGATGSGGPGGPGGPGEDGAAAAMSASAASPSAAASASWIRDDAGNVVAATLAIPGRARVTTVYGLDRCGRPVTIHDPVVGSVTIDRDPAGRPTAVAMPFPGAPGPPARLVERRRWVAGHLAGWRRAVEAGGEDAPVVAAELRHDLAGRVVAVVGSDGRRTRYAYDPAGQLVDVAVDGGGDWRFTWDRAGRLVGEATPLGTRRFVYDAAGQLTRIEGPAGTARIEWDRCGRRLAEHGPDGGGRRFRWDAVGRLTGVDVIGSGGVTRSRHLAHDPLDRLAEVDGAPVRWDPTGPLERLWAVGGHPQPAVLAPLVPLIPLAPPSAGGRSGGAADGGFVLDPWGVRPHRLHGLDGTAAGDGGAAGSFVLDVGHGPDHLDPGTGPAGPGPMPGLAVGARGELVIDGLAWLGTRAYDPATRSFLSPDPLPGLPGHPWTSHPYQYAANDPVGWADPTGLRPVTDAELAALRDGWHDDAGGRSRGGVVCWPLVLGSAAIPTARIDRQADAAPGGGSGSGEGFLAPGRGPAVRSTLVGAPASSGPAAGIRQAVDGDVDWARVGIDMVVGAGGPGRTAGGLRPGTATATGPLDRVATIGIVESTIGGMTARVIDGRNPFDPAGVATSVLGGGVAEGAGGHLGARNPGLEAATGATRWPGAHGTFADPEVQAMVDGATHVPGAAWDDPSRTWPAARTRPAGPVPPPGGCG